MRVCVCMRESRNTIVESKREKTSLWQTKHVMSGFPPSLPTITKTREAAPRGNNKEQKNNIYISHKEKERERKRGKRERGVYIRDQPLTIRKRGMDERREDKGDTTQPRSWRWEFMEMNAAHATRRCFPTKSLYEKTTLNEKRRGASSTLSVFLSLSLLHVRMPVMKFPP